MTSDLPDAPEGGRSALGAFDIGCVVIGGIIGVGIFFTPAKVANVVDSPWQVVVAWCIGGALALLGALVFAELSVRVPGHGGTFLYIRQAIGRLPAFLYGWANWLVIQAGALGIVALIMVDYLNVLVYGEQRMGADTRIVLAVVAMLLFTGINVLGLHLGKGVQNLLTVLKTLAVFFLVTLTWFVGGDSTPVAQPDGAERSLMSVLAAAMLPVLFSFGGWQQGSFLAGAARRPRLDVPLGIIGGVVVVVLAYITVNLAFLDLLGFEGTRNSDAVGADAASVALGSVGARVVAAMVVISALGIMNTICMAPPYVLLSMARQNLFPPAFGKLHPRFGTPLLAVVGQGLWAVMLLVGVHWIAGAAGASDTQGTGTGRTAETLDFVLNGVVFVDWLFFCLCGVALLRLRARTPAGSFRAPFGTVIAAVFALGSAAVVVGSISEFKWASLTGLAICALGVPVFLLMVREPLPDVD